MISRTIHLPNAHSKYKQQISKQEISISKWRTFSHRLLLTMHHPRVINHYISSKQKKKKNKKRKNQKKILLYKFSWRFLRRLAVINRRSQHRYITDTHTHTCILRTVARSAISVYEIKSRREGPRTSKIFFALLLRSPPPRTHVRLHVRFRFHSLFSAPNPPPPFSAFFRADDRHIERMQNGLRYIYVCVYRWCIGVESDSATVYDGEAS